MQTSSMLHDLIVDIHALDTELRRYEEKYNLLSEDFYSLYELGLLRDETVEESDEYGQWAGLYRMRLRRKELYNQEKVQIVHENAPQSTVVLKPYAVPEVV